MPRRYGGQLWSRAKGGEWAFFWGALKEWDESGSGPLRDVGGARPSASSAICSVPLVFRFDTVPVNLFPSQSSGTTGKFPSPPRSIPATARHTFRFVAALKKGARPPSVDLSVTSAPPVRRSGPSVPVSKTCSAVVSPAHAIEPVSRTTHGVHSCSLDDSILKFTTVESILTSPKGVCISSSSASPRLYSELSPPCWSAWFCWASFLASSRFRLLLRGLRGRARTVRRLATVASAPYARRTYGTVVVPSSCRNVRTISMGAALATTMAAWSVSAGRPSNRIVGVGCRARAERAPGVAASLLSSFALRSATRSDTTLIGRAAAGCS
mmetsp:Transcript_10959/g.29397  ORF Transcript_10959/g.29397 Transcript_10959/m.29397 type:complete len:325 (+) Transcript_10959:1085-2059(+)